MDRIKENSHKIFWIVFFLLLSVQFLSLSSLGEVLIPKQLDWILAIILGVIFIARLVDDKERKAYREVLWAYLPALFAFAVLEPIAFVRGDVALGLLGICVLVVSSVPMRSIVRVSLLAGALWIPFVSIAGRAGVLQNSFAAFDGSFLSSQGFSKAVYFYGGLYFFILCALALISWKKELRIFVFAFAFVLTGIFCSLKYAILTVNEVSAGVQNLIITFCLALLYVIAACRLWKRDLKLEAGLVLCAGVASLCGGFYLELPVNCFLLLAFSDMDDEKKVIIEDLDEIIDSEQKTHKQNWIGASIGGVVGAVITLFVVSRKVLVIRTCIDVLHETVDASTTFYFWWIALFMLAGWVLMIGLAIVGSSLQSILMKAQERGKEKGYRSFLFSTGLVGILIPIFGMIILSVSLQGKLSKSDSDVTVDLYDCEEFLQALPSQSLYVDSYPVFFREICGKGKLLYPTGDALSAKKGEHTLITSRRNDYEALLEAGYGYTPISDSYGIYTNEEAVISYMDELGIGYTDFYTEDVRISLADIARNREQTIDETGDLLVGDNPELENATCGPYLQLSAGDWIVEWNVHLDGFQGILDTNPETIIGNFYFTSDYGNHVFENVTITNADLDENHQMTVVASAHCYRTESDVEMIVRAESGAILRISEIRYRKVK